MKKAISSLFIGVGLVLLAPSISSASMTAVQISPQTPVTTESSTPLANTILLSDDFNGTAVNSSLWHIPTWTSNTDGTFIGRTQFQVTQNSPLPTERNGNVGIPIQTYNPKAPSSNPSFYGTELISNQTFTPGTQGLDITVRAKMDNATPGLVGGIFVYALKPGSNTYHDEIDYELVTNRPDQVQTNIYGNETLGAGHPQFISYPSGSITDYHTYEIKWFSNQVFWYIDGTLVRTVTSNIPAGPVNVYFNNWAPDSGWAEAYSPTIQPTNSSGSNQVLDTLYVDSISVQSISSTPTPVLKTITLLPLAIAMNPGITQQVTATTLDQNGNPISANLTWASSNQSVATVSSTGLVTAVGVGTANISASSSGVTDTAPAVVTVTTANPTVAITSVPNIGQYGNAVGSVAGMTPANYVNYVVAVYIKVAGGWWNKPFFDAPGTTIQSDGTWSANIATGGLSDTTATEIKAYLVPSSFDIPLVGGGALPSSLDSYPSADIVRNNNPFLSTITLSPLAVSLNTGATQQITATTLDQNGNPISATLAWFSDNTTVATVDSNGLVTAVSGGTANISASSSGVTSSASSVITVTSVTVPKLKTIVLSPTAANLVIGGATQQIAATTLDQNGKPISASLTWVSNKTSVARVSSLGVVTAVGVGTANITASSSGITSAPTVITVVKPVLKTITLSPLVINLKQGATQQITATTLDQNGNPISAALTWKTSSAAIATVSSTGLVTAVGAGTASISAVSGTIPSTAPATVTVTAAKTLKSITLSPLKVTLNSGATQKITAKTLDQNGKPITVTLLWTSDNTAAATVDSNGLVTAVSGGTANISASSSGVTSSASSVVTVISPAIQITSVPKINKSGNASGKVTGISPANYSNYDVAVYIKVAGGWWIKPYFAAPATAIKTGGVWTTNITTGGKSDTTATEIKAYLLPSWFTIPLVGGGALPSSLDQYPSADVTR